MTGWEGHRQGRVEEVKGSCFLWEQLAWQENSHKEGWRELNAGLAGLYQKERGKTERDQS